jgi:hypothetical protein
LGLEGKISWALNQCVHIDKFKKFSILKMWKKLKNVFALGPTTQATLVRIESKWKDLGGERERVKVRMAGVFLPIVGGWVVGIMLPLCFVVGLQILWNSLDRMVNTWTGHWSNKWMIF